MKLTRNRNLIPLRTDLTIISLITCMISSFTPASALNSPNSQDSQQLRFGFAGSIETMRSAINASVQKPEDPEARKAQTFTDQDLRKHIAQADLIMVGRVSAVRPLRQPLQRRPITEHNPQWQEAVVQVESVMKGRVSLKRVVVLFPGTLDVAWVGVPRFKVGQRGIWIVKRDRKTAAYAVVDPLDFHPRSQRDRVKRLIKPIRE